MFFFLSKFVPLFFYPVGLSCILIVVAVVIWKRRRWQTAVLILTVLILYLASTPLLANNLAKTLEWRYFPPDPLPQVDAIIVLGGSTKTAGFPQTTTSLNDASDRLLYAVWLYQQGVSDKLLLTAGKLPGEADTGAERMADALRVMGVPDEALLLEMESLNTYENAVFSLPLLAENNVDTMLLLTSAIHMPRSVGVFEAQGLQVIPAPTDYEVIAPDYAEGESFNPLYSVFLVLPRVQALELTTRVMKEYIGIVVYGWRGWL